MPHCRAAKQHQHTNAISVTGDDYETLLPNNTSSYAAVSSNILCCPHHPRIPWDPSHEVNSVGKNTWWPFWNLLIFLRLMFEGKFSKILEIQLYE